MAARLDALAREFFTTSSPSTPPQPRRRDAGGVGGGSSPTAATGVGVRGTDGAATLQPPTWEAVADGHETMGDPRGSRNKQRRLQLMAHDEAHFLPPLLQYFSELAMASTAMSSATHALLAAPSGVASAATIATMRTAAPGHASVRRHTNKRVVEGGGTVLRGRRLLAHERHQAEGHLNGNAGTAPGYAHSLSGHRPTSFRHLGVYSDYHLSPERIDVFANYPQPPLTDGGASYEALEPNHQRGLNALAALVEQCNRSFVQERGSAAASSAPLGKRVLNSESVSVGPSSATAGLSDQRDAIVNRLNILLRDLVAHGERVLALHVIMRAISWRFASKNERVTILFNHLRTCLPSASISIVTLAMEVWAQLHVIEASSSVYLRVTSELLSLACDFLHYDTTLAEQLSGLIIIRHVALWPTSLYRAILSNDRDSLLLATWTAIPNDGSPAFIRELAAEALRALFVIALEQRNYRSVNTVLQQAIILLLAPERSVEMPSSFSISPRHRLGGEGPHEFTPVQAGQPPQPIPPLTLAMQQRGGPHKGAEGETHAKETGGASLQLFGKLKRKITAFGQRLFGTSAGHRSMSHTLSASVNAAASVREATAAALERESVVSPGSCSTLPLFTTCRRSGASGAMRRKAARTPLRSSTAAN
ncbi:uncharacterized protein Tco025E_03149 [Trypanosoma conorhini]|uniref:Uncharacterized protein n=1 Tax=Trypanosoma conorhini TaxID=83891 RepID=A0A3R7LXJ2_9TRYP|nr:uncharacterized protein Tco025E_03149 [Trypanosoma conorhini]RNF22578.1 hypothetical protein Tco025E_03149 [Trypanosoma conorhini]